MKSDFWDYFDKGLIIMLALTWALAFAAMASNHYLYEDNIIIAISELMTNIIIIIYAIIRIIVTR